MCGLNNEDWNSTENLLKERVEISSENNSSGELSMGSVGSSWVNSMLSARQLHLCRGNNDCLRTKLASFCFFSMAENIHSLWRVLKEAADVST